MASEIISYADFLKIDIRSGTVVRAEPFLEARNPAFKVWVNFGDDVGVKKSSAQITVRHNAEDLVGQQVMAVVNFAPKQIGPFMSECLLLGFSDAEGHIVLVAPKMPVPDGERLH